MLPVVLFQAPHEKRAVERLVRFCKELDGTEVRVFTAPEPENMRYPEVANHSFRIVAKEMQGSPFLWIEWDCAPLVKGWAQILTDEYLKIGKPYLFAKTFNLPFDCYSGIGAFGPDAFKHSPENEKHVGFDEVVVRTYPDLIGRTELIRHSYGNYSADGQVTHHSFPRDIGIIGNKSVIFHCDKDQDIIRKNISVPFDKPKQLE